MPANRKISGTWRGRLVDIQGFEGELELNLKCDGNDKVDGTFAVAIGGHHSSLSQRGQAQGTISDKGVALSLIGKELPVQISLTGDVLNLKRGGIGLRGVYHVDSRVYSPLQGGITCVSKDQVGEVDVATRRTSSEPKNVKRSGGKTV